MTINLINIDTYLKAVVRTSRAIWESLRNQVSSLINIFFTVLPYSQHYIGTRKRHRFLQGDVQTLISDQTAWTQYAGSSRFFPCNNTEKNRELEVKMTFW